MGDRTPAHPDDWDVYGYDLRAGREFQVAGGPGAQLHPAISGNVVLWTQRTTSGPATLSTIMGRDLRSGRTFEVSDAGRYDDASISGTDAVWCTVGHGDVPVAVFGTTIATHESRPVVEPLQP